MSGGTKSKDFQTVGRKGVTGGPWKSIEENVKKNT